MGTSISTFCHCYSDDDSKSESNDCSQERRALLASQERQAVASLVKLFENDTRINFYEGEPLKSLTILAHSDVHHLQLSAATAFSEISEYDVRPISREALEPMLYLLQSAYTDVQHCASAALGNLAGVEENKRLIVGMGGVKYLVHQMLSPSTEAQINSVGCITNLAADEDNKLAIAKSGALIPLTRLARSADLRVQRNATGALLNMTHRADLRVMLMEAGSVAVLVELLESKDEDTQYYAVTALSNIAVDDSGRDVLWSTQPALISILLQALRKPKIKLQSQIALTLRNLASDERYQAAIVAHGGLDSLLPLLTSSYTLLIMSAAACLRNLSIHPDNEAPIVRAGFLPELLDLVLQMDEPELQCHVISTLRNFGANNGSDKQALIDAGLLDRIRMAVEDKRVHPTVRCELAAALSVFALNDQLWRPIVELGFCELLVRLMRCRHMETEYNACLAIGTLVGKNLPEVYEELMRLWQKPGTGLRIQLAQILTLAEYAGTGVRSVAIWIIMAFMNSSRSDLQKRIAYDTQLVRAVEEISKVRTTMPSENTGPSWGFLPGIFGNKGKDVDFYEGTSSAMTLNNNSGSSSRSSSSNSTAVDGGGPDNEAQRTQSLALQVLSLVKDVPSTC
ncbi:Vacuolar protein 8 [Coemansia sp. RSA 1843]|nr:Vacuolar protein 8 [Coemansia sp. RSA 1843]